MVRRNRAGQYRAKRSQVLAGLRHLVDGQIVGAKASHGALRYADPQSRALRPPPALLPARADEEIATGRREAAE